ncbi:hypothetical protein BH20VER3_BH20VER3_15410 [soil metagenome]
MRLSAVFAIYAHDQEGIDPLARIAIAMEKEKYAGLWQPDKIRMRDLQFPAIGQMHGERREGRPLNQISNLL